MVLDTSSKLTAVGTVWRLAYLQNIVNQQSRSLQNSHRYENVPQPVIVLVVHHTRLYLMSIACRLRNSCKSLCTGRGYWHFLIRPQSSQTVTRQGIHPGGRGSLHRLHWSFHPSASPFVLLCIAPPVLPDLSPDLRLLLRHLYGPGCQLLCFLNTRGMTHPLFPTDSTI